MFIYKSVTVFFLGIALINIRCFYGKPATDEDEEKKEDNPNAKAASTSTSTPSKIPGLLVLPRELQVQKTGKSNESFSPTKDNFLPWILEKLSNPADENVSQVSRSNEEAGVFRSPANYDLPKTSELPTPSFTLRGPREKAPVPSFIFRKTKEEAKREHRQIAPIGSQFSIRTSDQVDRSYQTILPSTDQDQLPRVSKVDHSSKFPHAKRPYVRNISRSTFPSRKPARPTPSHVFEQIGDRSYSRSGNTSRSTIPCDKPVRPTASHVLEQIGDRSYPKSSRSQSSDFNAPKIKFGSFGEESSSSRDEAVQADRRRTKKHLSIQVQSRGPPPETIGPRFRQHVRWEKKRSPTTEDEAEEPIQGTTLEHTCSRLRDSEGSSRIHSPRYHEKKSPYILRPSSSPRDIIRTKERIKASSYSRTSLEDERNIEMGGKSRGKGKISEEVEIGSKSESPNEKCILIVSKGNEDDFDIFEEIQRANLDLTNAERKLVKSQKAALITCKSKQEADHIRRSVRMSGTLDIKPMRTFPSVVRIHNIPMEIEESDIMRAIKLKFGEYPQEMHFIPYQDHRKDRLKIGKLNIGFSLLQQMEASPFIHVQGCRLRINTTVIVHRCKKCHLLGHFARWCHRAEREFPGRREPCIDCINFNRKNKVNDPETGSPKQHNVHHSTDSPICPTKQFYIHRWRRNQQSVDVFEDLSEDDSDEAQIEEYEINEQKNSSSEEEEEGERKSLEHTIPGEKEDDRSSEDIILFAGEEENKSRKEVQANKISPNVEQDQEEKEILEKNLPTSVEKGDKGKMPEKDVLPEEETPAKKGGPNFRVGLMIMPRNEDVDVYTELQNLNLPTDPCLVEDVLSFPSGSILLQCYTVEGAQCLEKHIEKSENLELL